MGNSVNGVRYRRVSTGKKRHGSKNSLLSTVSGDSGLVIGSNASSASSDDVAALNRPPFPFRAVTMLRDHTMVVNMAELRRLLLRSDVRDKPVVVLSIAGLFRKGKSFMLNFFIRYLENNHSNSSTGGKMAKNWLNTESSKKRGDFFCWHKEEAPSTVQSSENNIFMWSKPYFRQVPGIGEIVILLLDTQTSTFECPLTAKDCATVFALSTMLSSIQIFNVQGRLDESDLQHLDVFIKYGRTVLTDLRTKPFQNLVFLIRDWPRPYEHGYGFEGGATYLAELRGGPDPCRHHRDLERVWQRIDDCFESMCCFLMPHPGTAVATSEKYNGPLRQVDATFVDNLRAFIPRILCDENLPLKIINSNPVTCANLFNFLKTYAESLQSNQLPTIPDSLVASAAHLQYWSIFDAAKTYYEEEMDKIIESMQQRFSIEQLAVEHARLTAEAGELLLSDKRLVDDKQLHERYVGRLSKFTTKRFHHYAKLVENKNDALNRNGFVILLMEVGAYVKDSADQVVAMLPSFVQNQRFLASAANAITVVGVVCLCLAIIAVIGLPVLVSVLVGGALFYFSKPT